MQVQPMQKAARLICNVMPLNGDKTALQNKEIII